MAASEAPITDVAETAEEVVVPPAHESEKTTVIDQLEEKVKSKAPESLVSFKEESNRVSDLRDFEKRALNELKQLVQDAITNHEFTLQKQKQKQQQQQQPEQQQIMIVKTAAAEADTKAAEAVEAETKAETVEAVQVKESANKEIPALSTTTATTTTDPPNSETETPITDFTVTVKQHTESIILKEKASSENEGDTSNSSKKSEINNTTTSCSHENEEEEEVSIWGAPLLKDDRSDVILLKFLRARDFKVRDAFVMLRNTIIWRKEFNIDALVHQDLGDDLEKIVYMHGFDKEGHPVCYNVYGEFQNKELYLKTFGDEDKRLNFLRWRIQFLERSIRNQLDFSPGAINTIFQVSDLKNSPGPAKKELRLATRQALQLLQDNYPEFVAKQVFINVPWWYLAFYTMISPFLTQRTKSKFVFAGPSKTAETLFKYITPEQVPVQYGGMSVDFCDCNPEFTIDEPATEITIRPATKKTVEILVNEKCMIVWELRVVGWEVSYGAEYVPNDKGGYAVIIQKATKMAPTDEPVVCNSFKIIEFGKIVLTIDNPTSKKKKLLYRFKIKPYCD